MLNTRVLKKLTDNVEVLDLFEQMADKIDELEKREPSEPSQRMKDTMVQLEEDMSSLEHDVHMLNDENLKRWAKRMEKNK